MENNYITIFNQTFKTYEFITLGSIIFAVLIILFFILLIRFGEFKTPTIVSLCFACVVFVYLFLTILPDFFFKSYVSDCAESGYSIYINGVLTDSENLAVDKFNKIKVDDYLKKIIITVD